MTGSHAMRAVRRICIVGAAVAVSITHPAIRFRPHSVRRDEPPDAIARQLREAIRDTAEILVDDGDQIVARFAGQAGMFSYRTVELVTFAPAAVTFEHLHGPFRACHERFNLEPDGDGTTVMTHEGTFTMRLGLLGWLLGLTIVRRTFEDHVADHMVP